jgi:hypothetical protein
MSQLQDYFKSGLGILEDYVIPAVSLALAFTPAGPATGAIAIAAKVIPKIPDIIALTERLIGDLPGEQKKAFAMQAAQLVAQTVGGVSGGGQKETWDKISGFIGNLIDHSVSKVINAQDLEKQKAAAGG